MHLSTQRIRSLKKPDFFHPDNFANLAQIPIFMSIKYAIDKCRMQRMTRDKNHTGAYASGKGSFSSFEDAQQI